MSSKTLAVTVQSGRIRGAVIESSIGSLQVTGLFDVDASAAEAGAIPAAGPFDRVVSTLEPGAAMFRLFELPFRDRRRVSQAVGPTLEEHVPLSLDEGVLAWDFAGNAAAAAQTPVLAAIADADDIEAAKAALEALGVAPAPQRLLWAPSVVLSVYRRALGQDASFTAIDFGDAGAVIARIENGGVAALRVVAPCDDELLLRNTAWSLATVANGATNIVVGGCNAERLGKAISKRVAGLRVDQLPVASPVPGFDKQDWRQQTTLAGLILAASGDALAPTLDFEAGTGSIFSAAIFQELQGEVSPLLRWGAVAAGLAILAIGLDYVQLFTERNALAGRAETIYTSAMPSGSGGAGRKLKMEMRLRELTGKAELANTGGAGSPLALLAALSRDIPKSLDVVVDQVEHSPPTAKVLGHAFSFESVTKMQQALQKGGAFSRVEVKDVHAAVTGGGVEFLLDLSTVPSEEGA